MQAIILRFAVAIIPTSRLLKTPSRERVARTRLEVIAALKALDAWKYADQSFSMNSDSGDGMLYMRYCYYEVTLNFKNSREQSVLKLCQPALFGDVSHITIADGGVVVHGQIPGDVKKRFNISVEE